MQLPPTTRGGVEAKEKGDEVKTLNGGAEEKEKGKAVKPARALGYALNSS
jgi:hypothetical protein